MNTYSVSVWDHERGWWEVRYPNVLKWSLRGVLRGLRREGWDDVSVLVEANEP